MELRFFLFLSLVFASVACSPVSVVYTDPAVGNFQMKYRTFDFLDFTVDNQTAVPANPRGVDYLKAAIERELIVQGFKKVERDPDMFINIGVVISDEVQTRQTDIRDAPLYMGTRNYYWESEEVVVNQYREGTVMVDLVDADKNELIWEGAAKAAIIKNPDKMKKRIDEMIAKLMKKLSD